MTKRLVTGTMVTLYEPFDYQGQKVSRGVIKSRHLDYYLIMLFCDDINYPDGYLVERYITEIRKS